MEILVKKNKENEIILGMKGSTAEKAKHFDYVDFIEDLLANPQEISVNPNGCLDEDAVKELDKMARRIQEKVDSSRKQIDLLSSDPEDEEKEQT